MTVQKAESTKMGQLNLHDSSFRRHENAASHKSVHTASQKRRALLK